MRIDATNLVTQALGQVPSQLRREATEAVYLTALGYGTMEVGRRMGVPWQKVNTALAVVGSHLTVQLRVDGYTAREITNLGIPTAFAQATTRA